MRNPDYYRAPLPYLDGFVGIFSEKQAVRVAAIKSDRAAIEFRGFPPSTRDELKAALGDQLTVQESDWNCGSLVTLNHARKPFDDVRVRRALTLAIDRWHGAAGMSKITIMRTVGGVAFPGSPLAATKEELQQIAGYWPDIEKSRAEARRLLKEAGAENLTFELLNRNVDQPYKFNATWAIDEWSKIGVHATQRVLSTGPFGDATRRGEFAVVSTATARTSSTRCSTAPNTCRTRSQARISPISRTRKRSKSIIGCCARAISRNSAPSCASSKNWCSTRAPTKSCCSGAIASCPTAATSKASKSAPATTSTRSGDDLARQVSGGFYRTAS